MGTPSTLCTLLELNYGYLRSTLQLNYGWYFCNCKLSNELDKIWEWWELLKEVWDISMLCDPLPFEINNEKDFSLMVFIFKLIDNFPSSSVKALGQGIKTLLVFHVIWFHEIFLNRCCKQIFVSYSSLHILQGVPYHLRGDLLRWSCHHSCLVTISPIVWLD